MREENRIQKRAYRENHKEQIAARQREYSKNNRAKINARKRAWRATNRDHCLEYQRQWKERNPNSAYSYTKKYVENNRHRVNAHQREYVNSNPSRIIRKRISARIYHAVTKQALKKPSSTMKLTGCDVNFLMGYLEARFQPGMKWSNYGSVWEIDHRVPCASFDLTDESHQRSCFHYSNLQPLFVTDNRRKHVKMPSSHQAELV